MEENIEFSLIASPLKTEPSPMDHVDALGVDSARFVTLTSLRSYALANLPFNEVTELLSKKEDFLSISNRLRNFFDSVTVINESEEQNTWLPTWEIHRPSVKGCTAILEVSSNNETDYSLSVKVFGIGGGINKSRKVGIRSAIKVQGYCKQVRLPVTFTTQ